MGNVLDCAEEPPTSGEGKEIDTATSFGVGESNEEEQQERNLRGLSDLECLQRSVRLSDSDCILWKLQKDFYKDVGPQAWTEGIVPNYVSSNSFIAQCYAKVILEFANEWYTGKIDGQPDMSEPIYILELGAGSGKFSFLLVTQLLQLCEYFPANLDTALRGFPFRVVVTDVARKNLEFWFSHSKLKPLFDRGFLDAALLDAENIGEKIVLVSGKIISVETLKNPIVCIANYVFNSLSHDAYRVQTDGFYVAECTISSSAKTFTNIKGEKVEPKPHELIQWMSVDWVYKKMQVDGLDLYKGDESFNSIPKKYVKLITGALPDGMDRAKPLPYESMEFAGNSSILVPLGGMKLLRDLNKICYRAKVPLLTLVGDKGYGNHTDMLGVRDPHIAKHGSFSFMVNFHALSLYAESMNGFSVVSPYSDGFKCALLGFNFAKNKAPMTCTAFEEWADNFGPESFSSLQRCDRAECNAPTLKHAFSLLRLGGNDADVFQKFRSVIISKVGSLETSPHTRADLRKTIKGVLENYFPLHKNKDVCFEVARVYMGLKDYRTAIRLFDCSIEDCGRHHVTTHNQGICFYYLEEYESAMEKFQESLSINEKYQEAKNWLKKTEERISERNPLQPIEVDGANFGTNGTSASFLGGRRRSHGIMEV